MRGTIWGHKGSVQRTQAEQTALAVRILDELHAADVAQRIGQRLGDRRHVVGRPDLSRNLLRSWVARLGRAYRRPPLVDGLAPELAGLMGDYSARTLVTRYATAEGRPLPTEHVRASKGALRYWLGGGMAGVLLDWSEREGRISLQVIPPDDLQPLYGDDNESEPTIIRHRGIREIKGKSAQVVEVYDLTDLENPSYRILQDDQDVTEEVLGETFDGARYWWRDQNGRPFHRIVMIGHPRLAYMTNPLIEATLIVAARWTAWGAAMDDAGYPQRNVRGLRLVGMDSDADSGQAGIATGPETILQWEDVDPEKPGTHWQDGPGFDPEVVGRAIRVYESSALSALGLPVDFEGTGGEPTETERRAMAELIAETFPDLRRMDSEILRRAASIANRIDAVEGAGFDESPYGVLYGDEIIEAFDALTNNGDDS